MKRLRPENEAITMDGCQSARLWSRLRAACGWLLAAVGILTQSVVVAEVMDSLDSGPLPREAAPIVIVLSWDGMRHDYPDLDSFPALERIARQGVRAGRLTPVFPSSTFPGHVSMATGTYPDAHGIVGNVFLDPEQGRYSYEADANWIEAEPLWIAAERQGVPAATYFWVGSETDWHGQGTRYRMAPFDRSRPEADKVDRILDWLALPEAERPRLIMSYWAGADAVGHRQGPASAAVIEEIHRQDRELGRLLEGIDRLGLWNRTTLLVVSDHGMTAVHRYLDLDTALGDRGIDAMVEGGAVAHVYLREGVNPAEVSEALETILADVPGAEFHRRGALPAHWRLDRSDRTGDWVVSVPPPWSFHTPRNFDDWLVRVLAKLGWTFGGHGYDPAHPDMGGVFLAMGAAVPAGLRLGSVHQVDLAATVAAMLGIEPPQHSEGRPMWAVPGPGRNAAAH